MHAEGPVVVPQGECVRFGLHIDATIMFSDRSGVYRPEIEKRRAKLLQKLGFLSKFLEPGEKVLLVTTACSPFTWLEQLTMGAVWLMAVKRAVLVFTTKRLLHIPTTTACQYRGSIAQVLYEDCKRLQIKGSGLVAEYHSGKKERFAAIPRGDRQIIKRFRLEPGPAERPSAQPHRNYLCPGCKQLLPPNVGACPSCGLPFKSQSAARMYSILLPGGGYFYTNHVVMGVIDAMVESYLILVTLVCALVGVFGDARALPSAGVFGMILFLEKLITIFHSNAFLDEFLPQSRWQVLNGPAAPVEMAQALPMAGAKVRARPEEILSVR